MQTQLHRRGLHKEFAASWKLSDGIRHLGITDEWLEEAHDSSLNLFAPDAERKLACQ